MHTITTNDIDGFIEVTIKGMCTLPEIRQFATELRAAIMAFPDRGRPAITLYDFTNASIQTQEVVAEMKKLAESPGLVHRRVALYTEGVLARLQAIRISENRDNMRVFNSRTAAIAWLKGDAADVAVQAAPLRATG